MRDWNREAQDIFDDSKHERLLILVWGPGVPDASTPADRRKGYEKRIQIKEVLTAEFPRASVHFSEDPDMLALGLPTMSRLDLERLHAAIADLIIILPISPGSQLELNHFIPTAPAIRDKISVLLPERHKSSPGLVTQEILDFLKKVKIIGYTQDEWDVCKVATEKSVQIGLEAALKKRFQPL